MRDTVDKELDKNQEAEGTNTSKSRLYHRNTTILLLLIIVTATTSTTTIIINTAIISQQQSSSRTKPLCGRGGADLQCPSAAARGGESIQVEKDEQRHVATEAAATDRRQEVQTV
jgi:hypothetical protein